MLPKVLVCILMSVGIILVGASWFQTGYSRGKIRGYEEGKSSGYDRGMLDGFEKGKLVGYEEAKFKIEENES